MEKFIYIIIKVHLPKHDMYYHIHLFSLFSSSLLLSSYKQETTTAIIFSNTLHHSPIYSNIHISTEVVFVVLILWAESTFPSVSISATLNFILHDLLLSDMMVPCTTMSSWRNIPLFADILPYTFSTITPLIVKICKMSLPSGLGIYLSFLGGRNYFIMPECRTPGTCRVESYAVSYGKVFPDCWLILMVLSNRD